MAINIVYSATCEECGDVGLPEAYDTIEGLVWDALRLGWRIHRPPGSSPTTDQAILVCPDCAKAE